MTAKYIMNFTFALTCFMGRVGGEPTDQCSKKVEPYADASSTLQVDAAKPNVGNDTFFHLGGVAFVQRDARAPIDMSDEVDEDETDEARLTDAEMDKELTPPVHWQLVARHARPRGPWTVGKGCSWSWTRAKGGNQEHDSVKTPTDLGFAVWDLKNDAFEATDGQCGADYSVPQNYTMCYWIFWKSTGSGRYHTLSRTKNGHVVLTVDGFLGMWSSEGFRTSGFKVDITKWNYVCVVGEGDQAAGRFGTSTFYVYYKDEKGGIVGTADRVASGEKLTQIGDWLLGGNSQGPGYLASVHAWKQALSAQQLLQSSVETKPKPPHYDYYVAGTPGDDDCPPGFITPSLEECEFALASVHKGRGDIEPAGTRGFQVDSGTDRNKAAGWGGVPSGCSFQKGNAAHPNGDNTAHFNTGTREQGSNTNTNINNGLYTRVCKAQVKVCAKEGDICPCNGVVYYGRQYVTGMPGNGQKTSLRQLLKDTSYRTKQVYVPQTCKKNQFGTDPAYGYSKHCFCVSQV